MQATGRHHAVAALDRGEQPLALPLLGLLRTDQQEVEHGKDRGEEDDLGEDGVAARAARRSGASEHEFSGRESHGSRVLQARTQLVERNLRG